MTKQAEAEAFVNKSRRVIHNQSLIQLLAVFAIAMPLPLTGLIFWTAFGLSSPIIAQTMATLWIAATIVYVASTTYVKARQRKA
jgi:hypothetical protein